MRVSAEFSSKQLHRALQVKHSKQALSSYSNLKWSLVVRKGHAAGQWLGHYATSRKVAGSRYDEAKQFFSIYLIFPAWGLINL
jgi:hypothetical protein